MFQRADLEHKKVTNTPITGKIPWLKFVAVMVVIMAVAAIAWLMYDSGTFDSGFSVPGFEFGSSGPDPIKQWTDKYTPEELRAAIDRGEVDYDDVPKELQRVVDSVKLPQVQPVPNQ